MLTCCTVTGNRERRQIALEQFLRNAHIQVEQSRAEERVNACLTFALSGLTNPAEFDGCYEAHETLQRLTAWLILLRNLFARDSIGTSTGLFLP